VLLARGSDSVFPVCEWDRALSCFAMRMTEAPPSDEIGAGPNVQSDSFL
jgi:hypothetical protein